MWSCGNTAPHDTAKPTQIVKAQLFSHLCEVVRMAVHTIFARKCEKLLICLSDVG